MSSQGSVTFAAVLSFSFFTSRHLMSHVTEQLHPEAFRVWT